LPNQTDEIPEAQVSAVADDNCSTQPSGQQPPQPSSLPEAAMAYHVVDEEALPYPYQSNVIIIPTNTAGHRVFPDPSSSTGGIIIADMENPGTFFYVNDEIPPGETGR